MNFCILPHRLQVMPDGFLPRGYYYYRVAASMTDGDVDLANTLRVWASYRNNTVGIFWEAVPGARAYKVTRRTEDGEEQSFTVFGSCFFYDNGLNQ